MYVYVNYGEFKLKLFKNYQQNPVLYLQLCNNGMGTIWLTAGKLSSERIVEF